jgi:hypothetical protein
MPGIYVAEILTTALALAIFGTLIVRLRLPANMRLLLLAALIVLPLQPLAFYFVRLPIDHWLVAHLGPASRLLPWVRSLYAPLTEEPAKLVPLLIPAIRRDVRRENFVRYALAIGLGFAIGEMWFVAHRVAHAPAYARMPLYQFGGYVTERLMTCVFHSAFVAVALWRLRGRFLLGFAGAVALHWLGNFPISLMNWNVGKLGKTFWLAVVNVWLLVYFFACAALLSRFAFGRITLGKLLFSTRHCPECGKDYDAPLFAVNLGSKRYERCPHCRRWHVVRSARILETLK